MASNFGALTALTSGAATLQTQSGQQFFYIQNNDANPLTLTFKDSGGNTLGQIVLNQAPVAGSGGGYIDSVSFPTLLDCQGGGTVVLAGTGSGQFSSGASKLVPTHIFTADQRASRGR